MFAPLEDYIKNLAGAEYAMLLVVLILIAGYLVYYTYTAFQRFRFIDGTATSKIRSAAQGHVELKGLGELMQDDVIVSPFSNSRCIWYHCTIEKKRRTGKRVTWTNISDECSHHLFHLVDETGLCIIDPEDAHVIAETDRTWYGAGSQDRLNPRQSGAWPISFGAGRYRFRERLIRPATQLYALGWFRSFHSDPSPEWIQTQVEDLVKQWKLQPGKYLRDYDFDQNGKIQKAEWKAIRAIARKQVLARINSENRAQHLLSRPEDKRHPFILSAIDEESLVARKKMKAWLSISCAMALFIALTILLSIRSPVSL